MTDVFQMPCEWTTSGSTDENVVRMAFTCFLNLGTFDQHMHIEDTPKSNDVRIIGLAFTKKHGAALREAFDAWVKTDQLASFMFAEFSIKSQMADHSQENPFPKLVETIVGTRFKEVTGLNRKLLPKDLKKSFLTKASNRLRKFATVDYNDPHYPWKDRSIEEWLRIALVGTEGYLWSSSLREIRNLYHKFGEHESLDELIPELMNQAQVLDVMTK